MKLRLVLSLVTAVICAIAGIDGVPRHGDPSSKIAEFERALESSFKEKIVFSGDRQDGKAPKTYRFRDKDGRVLEVEGDETLTARDMDALFSLLPTSRQVPREQLPPRLVSRLGKVIQVVPGCGDLHGLWPFTEANFRTAKAKLAVRYETEPMSLFGMSWKVTLNPLAYTLDPDSFYDRDSPWSRRFEHAASPWEIEEEVQFRTRELGAGAALGAAGFVGGFCGLAMLSWVWRFLLRRISELSSVIRGKQRSQ